MWTLVYGIWRAAVSLQLFPSNYITMSNGSTTFVERLEKPLRKMCRTDWDILLTAGTKRVSRTFWLSSWVCQKMCSYLHLKDFVMDKPESSIYHKSRSSTRLKSVWTLQVPRWYSKSHPSPDQVLHLQSAGSRLHEQKAQNIGDHWSEVYTRRKSWNCGPKRKRDTYATDWSFYQIF